MPLEGYELASDQPSYEPVEHYPFEGQEVMEVLQRLEQVEGMLAQLASAVEALQRTMEARKRIVRDADGRPTHVEIDQEGATGGGQL